MLFTGSYLESNAGLFLQVVVNMFAIPGNAAKSSVITCNSIS